MYIDRSKWGYSIFKHMHTSAAIFNRTTAKFLYTGKCSEEERKLDANNDEIDNVYKNIIATKTNGYLPLIEA